jgi:nitrogen fixation/metabolism regulation signal transduction histidine kinase
VIIRQRYRFGAGLLLLLGLMGLVIWQGSFTVGEYGPGTPEQTYVFWGMSTLIFVLTVLVGFLLFRDAVKLYFARRAGVEGSRIRTKILIGAVSLTMMPTFFLVVWSVEVLNRNLDKWFSRPGENIRASLGTIGQSLERETRLRGEAIGRWVASSPELEDFLNTGHLPAEFFAGVCTASGAEEVSIRRQDGGQISVCQQGPPEGVKLGREVQAGVPAPGGGKVMVRLRMPLDLAQTASEINAQVRDYDRLASTRKEMRRFYLQLLLLITLFILFFAMWVAFFLARQISAPVTALLDAARAVRGGDLSRRVRVAATDELASLVRAFNEMIQDLGANQQELDARRRFIEAVLESIPSGVISLSPDGAIQLVNSAMRQILPHAKLDEARRLSELLPEEMQTDFARLLKRARRTGSAARQLELDTADGVRHLAVTVSAVGPAGGGYVMVIEDTSDLLRAQKAAAWHEVARRIAHELKNPLTPIALSTERVLRQLEKTQAPPEVRRIIQESCALIAREVETVKSLVDEFSRFARFPAALPAPCDLNAVVEEGLAVFSGRLEGITLHRSLADRLPLVALDREQFKRVVVNLVDNAAEALSEAPLKHLYIQTRSPAPETVELVIADTGCGISAEDKEKLFLPYFSTKQRGTGLGLAIVSHIVGEHNAHIRVEDNQPSGARFIIDLPAAAAAEADSTPLEVPA